MAHPNARFIEWADTIQSKHLSQNIVIDGYGIPIYDLWKVANRSINFVNPQAPSGITDINYQHEISVGEEVEIGVKTNGLQGQKLVLQGLGEKYDSALIASESSIEKLRCKLKAVGMYVLTLSLYDQNGQLINAESVPVKVNPAKKFDVLLINAFPTFETRFLKQFLEASGHNYFIRNQISTNRYRYESKGMSINEMPRLTNKSLKNFDVVIIHASQLEALPSSQQQAISNAIKDEGLGILIIAGEGELVKKLPQWASVNYKAVKNEVYKLSNDNDLEIITSPYRFIPSALSEAVYEDTEGALVQSKPYGLGKVVLSSFTNSYELSLAGNEKAYQNLWKNLMESCLMPQGQKWSFQDEFYYVDRPMKFEFRSDTLTRVIYRVDELAPKQNMLVSDRWESQVWPLSTGWNYIDIDNQDEGRQYFYVHQSGDFEGVQIAKRIKANKKTASESSKLSAAPIQSKVDISLWWFYMIFTISMAYLWLQPKFR